MIMLTFHAIMCLQRTAFGCVHWIKRGAGHSVSPTSGEGGEGCSTWGVPHLYLERGAGPSLPGVWGCPPIFPFFSYSPSPTRGEGVGGEGSTFPRELVFKEGG